MSETLKGKAIKGITRASRRYQEGRVCADPECETKLSMYNKREYCNVHAPVKFFEKWVLLKFTIWMAVFSSGMKKTSNLKINPFGFS